MTKPYHITQEQATAMSEYVHVTIAAVILIALWFIALTV